MVLGLAGWDAACPIIHTSVHKECSQRALIDSGQKENAQSNNGEWHSLFWSEAIKAKEAMDSAVTDLLQLELIHYGST